MGGGGGSRHSGGSSKGGGGYKPEKHPIRDFFKKVKEFFFGSSESSSNDIANTNSYDSGKAELEETLRVSKAFEEFRTLVSQKAEEFEKNAVSECWDQLDELMDFLRSINNKDYSGEKLRINLTAMERENREIVDSIHGSIKKDILAKVSLDNPECQQILTMDAGQKKKEAMNDYMNKAIRVSMDNLASRIKKSLNKNCDNIEDRISARLADISDTLEAKTKDFNDFSKLASGNKKDLEKKQLEVSGKMAEYSIWLNLLDSGQE